MGFTRRPGLVVQKSWEDASAAVGFACRVVEANSIPLLEGDPCSRLIHTVDDSKPGTTVGAGPDGFFAEDLFLVRHFPSLTGLRMTYGLRMTWGLHDLQLPWLDSTHHFPWCEHSHLLLVFPGAWHGDRRSTFIFPAILVVMFWRPSPLGVAAGVRLWVISTLAFYCSESEQRSISVRWSSIPVLQQCNIPIVCFPHQLLDGPNGPFTHAFRLWVSGTTGHNSKSPFLDKLLLLSTSKRHIMWN